MRSCSGAFGSSCRRAAPLSARLHPSATLSSIPLTVTSMVRPIHVEQHYTHRIGWLRAAVLGANDGIVSTAALVVGVAAAKTGRSNVLVAGVAGLCLLY